MENKNQIKGWFKDGVKYDKDGAIIWTIEKSEKCDYLHRIADIRGWGEIQNLFKLDMNKAAEFQDAVGEFIVDAINEKLKSLEHGK